MLRAAPLMLCLPLAATGCLWEPVQQAPIPGNDDVAPVIAIASPPSNDLFLSSVQGDPCVAIVSLPSVYFPRGTPLQASFFLNFDPRTNPAPLSIDGQVQFSLQKSQAAPNTYSLPPQQIHLGDFVSDFSGRANVLQVYVSDDLDNCPNPSAVVKTADQNLLCYTTSWVWVIEPFGCSIL